MRSSTEEAPDWITSERGHWFQCTKEHREGRGLERTTQAGLYIVFRVESFKNVWTGWTGDCLQKSVVSPKSLTLVLFVLFEYLFNA